MNTRRLTWIAWLRSKGPTFLSNVANYLYFQRDFKLIWGQLFFVSNIKTLEVWKPYQIQWNTIDLWPLWTMEPQHLAFFLVDILEIRLSSTSKFSDMVRILHDWRRSCCGVFMRRSDHPCETLCMTRRGEESTETKEKFGGRNAQIVEGVLMGQLSHKSGKGPLRQKKRTLNSISFGIGVIQKAKACKTTTIYPTARFEFIFICNGVELQCWPL